MSDPVRRTFAARLCRFLPPRLARRFVREEKGATAVEFALVAAPFLALLFAIMETAFVFFAGQTLEAATADSSRLIMTGQAQTAKFSKADFKTQVCNRIYGLFDCANGIHIDVKSYGSSAPAAPVSPVSNGQLNTGSMTYNTGGPGDIVVVSLYYEWPVYVTLLGNNLSNLSGNKRLLTATAVFRNEPYN